MPLLLNASDIRTVLTMDDCLKALESGFRQEGLGTAANRNKSVISITPQSGQTTHYVTFEAGIRNPPVFALVLRSHVPESAGPPGGQFVMLFSGETGELLALLRNREIGAYRLGGTAGLAAREMARHDAKVVGILGSGDSARAHALAYDAVREIELFKVYSPNPEHRADFARWVTQMTEVPTQAMTDPEAVVRGSDIVAACTTAQGPIVKSEWLDRPSVHMTSVQLRWNELEPEGLKHFDHLVTYLCAVATHHPTEPDGQVRVSGTTEEWLAQFNVIPRRHTLVDVLLGKAPGRESETERNYFFSEGTGVQFASISAVVYERARERGVGQEMPPEWAKWFRYGGDF